MTLSTIALDLEYRLLKIMNLEMANGSDGTPSLVLRECASGLTQPFV